MKLYRPVISVLCALAFCALSSARPLGAADTLSLAAPDSTLIAATDTIARVVADSTAAAVPDSTATRQVSDSTATRLVPDSTGLSRHLAMDAGRSKHMMRARPKDKEPFYYGRFLMHSSVSASVSGYRLFNPHFSSGPMAAVSFSKWFNQFHGARVSLGTGYYIDNFDARSIKHADLQASYLFNFSSYILGYDSNRFVEFIGVTGVGGGFAWRREAHGGYFNAHLGLQANLHITGSLDFFIEPRLELVTDALKLSRVNNSHNYFGGFGGAVGVSYSLDSRLRRVPEGDWFVYFTGGVQMQQAQLSFSRLHGVELIGASLNGGAGRYFGQAFALRLGADVSHCNWSKSLETGKRLSTDYYAVSIEGLYDFVALANKGEEPKHFSAAVLFGSEMGYMLKRDISLKIRSAFVGLTGGIQLKYRIGGTPFAVALEPRIMFVPYSAPISRIGENPCVNRNYYDFLDRVVIGIEYRL